MSPICMIVGDVIANQAAQVRFIEGNHMIEKLTAAASDPALGNSVGLSPQQHPIVTMEIESSKSHIRFIHSPDLHLSW